MHWALIMVHFIIRGSYRWTELVGIIFVEWKAFSQVGIQNNITYLVEVLYESSDGVW